MALRRHGIGQASAAGGESQGIFLAAAKRGHRRRFYSIAQLANAYGIPYEHVDNPNKPEFTDALQQRSPDLLISVACPYILKEKLLGIPPRGCINIHHAPLPRYKGMMPTFWQLYHGEQQLGVTIHYMAAKVDEGDALLQESLPVTPGESLHDADPPQQAPWRALHGQGCAQPAIEFGSGNTDGPRAGKLLYFSHVVKRRANFGGEGCAQFKRKDDTWQARLTDRR